MESDIFDMRKHVDRLYDQDANVNKDMLLYF